MADAAVRAMRLGSVLVLVIDAPPVNALSHVVRQGLWDAVVAAETDPEVQAVVLAAEGRTFPVGADIAEFDAPPHAPLLPDLCDRIEGCTRPVVAALHGTALGGGLELALAAHGRVMQDDAQAGLPEVSLGLLPGAGGTQRLPRLVGASAALEMMLTGRPVGAEAARAMGLVDVVATGALLIETAVALAEVLAERGAPMTRDRRDGMTDPAAYALALSEARQAVDGAPTEAPGRIVDCVEAAMLLPFAQGLAFERAAFHDLVGSDAAWSLRQGFQAERRAARDAAGAALPAAMTVVGAGPAGSDLALSGLRAGLAVTLADVDQAALVPGLQRIAAAIEAAGGADADWNRLTPALSDDPGPGSEGPVVLTGAFVEAALSGVAMPRGPQVPVLALGGPAAADRMGLILHGGGLAEVLVTPATGAAPQGAALALARRLGWVAVTARGSVGLVAPMLATLTDAARHLAARHGAAIVAAVLDDWQQRVPELPEGGSGAKPAGRSAIALSLLVALANQGLRLLGSETARRPSDIDLALRRGMGWPGHVPGPMLWADRRGMLVVRADLAARTAQDPGLWQPAPLIDMLIAQEQRLSALDNM